MQGGQLMNRWPRRWVLRLAVAAGLVSGAQLQAQGVVPLPAGMSFVAQDASGAWALFRVNERRAAQRIVTEQEPRQACVTPDGAKAVYAAADGSLRLWSASGGSETVVARSDAKRSFTQPCMSADGRELYAVEMADGKSLETEILRFDAVAGETVRVARQPGAQHDPFVHQRRWLVYGSVGCSDGCEELLVEIWVRDLVAGKARQISLLNALSQNPVTDGRRVVFSSNASGTHQLWQVAIEGGAPRQLTQGPAQATSPALCDGALFFVRSRPGHAAVARLEPDGTVTELAVPDLTSFRALRCL